ncbi:hypothetical protein VTK26DRAFT_2057 [Humicola hyalothermophila]
MVSTTPASIPRFLLPQSGLIWRRVAAGRSAGPSTTSSVSAPASRRILLRLASSGSSSSDSQQAGRFSRPSQQTSQEPSPSGQRVLAKPERFNPPSHGARLPRKNSTPRHYGGELSTEEVKAQEQRDYPGMMAPKGTRAYWFWHSRWIHVAITVGTLSGLAIWTFALNFQATSPFADMLPPASDYLRHPVSSVRTLIEVLQLHEAHKSARIAEKRQRHVEDVAKRAAYRKAHGLPDEMGLFNQPMAKINLDGDGDGGNKGAGAVDDASPVNGAPAAAVGQEQQQQQQQQQQGAVAVGGGEKGEIRPLNEEQKKEVAKEAKGKWLGIF